MLVLGCGPRVEDGSGSGGGSAEGSSDASSSESGPVTSAETFDTTPMTSSSATEIGDTSSSSFDTGDQPDCVQGIFEGIAYSGFETASFESCETGDIAWFENTPYPCEEAWVQVEGTLCGPGSYGHLGGYTYQLSGVVISDPCTNACGEPPTGCGPAEEICATSLTECDIATQDCKVMGQTCVPVSMSGSPPWTGTQCIDDTPGGAEGDPCNRAGNDDDCGPGLWCIPDAFDSITGECVAFCPGGACPGECVECSVDFGSFPVCEPSSGAYAC